MLTPSQSSAAAAAYPGVEVYCSAAAQLYTASGGSWEYTGICGAASLMIENDIYYARVFHLDSSEVVYEQELYNGFSFVQPMPFLVTYEASDSVHGLSFANDGEAAKFVENLAICVEDMGGTSTFYTGGQASAPPTQAYSPPATAPSPAAYDPPAPSSPPASKFPPIPSSIPEPTPVAAPVSTPAAAPSSTPINNASNQGNQRQAPRKMEKKKKKGSRFGGLFGGSKKKKPAEMVIGGPTGFQHESHIGWDMENGFDIRNIPPEWRKLFQAAGVKKSDLQDADTRKLIVSTINASGVAPPVPAGGPPAGGPPPPAPPPPPAAPPAPAPPTFGGPPPPGPPPPAASSGGGVGGLQAALQAKKAVLSDATTRAPEPATSFNAGQTSLVDTLSGVLASRRGHLEQEDEGDDDEWSDDWSDD